VDLLVINDQEVLELSGEKNLEAGAKAVLAMGPKTLIIKKGKNGATLYTENGYFWAPPFPVDLVKDPTGAGDTFAGGFMGYLAMTDDLSEANMRRAILFGTAMASFTIEDFSVYPLKELTAPQINDRFNTLLDIIHCERGKML
jgi:sugar/nucleoside kinase (ribokinase family)